MTAGDGSDEGDADRHSDGNRQGNPRTTDTRGDTPTDDGRSDEDPVPDEDRADDGQHDADEEHTGATETDDSADASDTAEPGDKGGRFDDSPKRRQRSKANHAHGAPESVARGPASGGGSDAEERDGADSGAADETEGDATAETATDSENEPNGDDDLDERPVGTQKRQAGATPAAAQESAAEGEQTEKRTAMEQTEEQIASAVETAKDPVPSGDSGMFEGAPDDEEMPLTEHIEEMIKRLGVVIVIMAGVSLITFPIADWLINTLWYSFLPGSPEQCAGGVAQGDACPRVYHPLGLIFARLKVASLAGFIIALPAFVYQTYLFMRPGLYPHERRYYLASVPTSLVLALVGVAFAYFLVLPFIFTYFLAYSEPVANIAFGLTETFDLILLMMGLFAAIFQIPLFIMLAIMMGVTTRRWLEQRRLLFWASFGGVAFLFSPDPTGMAPFLVAATMIVLFEGTLLVLRWTNR
jgi:sec-independent protein translocase protein TatC